MEYKPLRRPTSKEAREQAEQIRRRRERLLTQALLSAVLIVGALILSKLDAPLAVEYRTRLSEALAGDRAEDAVAAFQSLTGRLQGHNEEKSGTDAGNGTDDGNETSANGSSGEETPKKITPPGTSSPENS